MSFEAPGGAGAAQNKRVQAVLRIAVVLGVGMIVGDGVLTPSMSVLSSIEGLAVADPTNPHMQKGQRARPVAALVHSRGTYKAGDSCGRLFSTVH